MSQIWNGSYTLGNSQETEIVGGTGIKIDDSVPGVIGIGTDETVLWSAATMGAEGVTSATMSESFTNFEQLEVWWAQQSVRTTVQRYYTDNLNQLFCVHGKYTEGKSGPHLFIAAWSISGTSASKEFCKYKSPENWNSNNWTDANELCPCKIIGINRISGGNE